MMGTGMGAGGFGSFGLIGMILNLVITVGVIIGIVWLVRRAGVNGQTAFGPASTVQLPREIVGARYARGEISRDEYQAILADLS